jgi:hypothetical protein
VPVTTPLVVSGQFKGVLSAAVLLSQLTEDYLAPLKISSQTEVYILDSQGVFLNVLDENLVGKNVYQYIEENPFLGSGILIKEIERRMKEGEEGKLQAVWPEGTAQTGLLTRKLLSTMPWYNDK